jgi:polyphosphate kinase
MPERAPELFFNRELSWLAFNDRVLAQAQDASLPIYERLKFFGIASANLDEFFMVRVAGLKQLLLSGVMETQADGMLPAEQLAHIHAHVGRFMRELDETWSGGLLPALTEAGVELLHASDMSRDQERVAKQVFRHEIFPTLTPIALDPGHPFPHLRSKTLNVAVQLKRKAKTKRRNLPERMYALVQVPAMLPRFIRVPTGQARAYVLLESLIERFASALFPGFTVIDAASFRLSRNWDLDVDEEEAEDLLSAVQEELRRRDRGAAVRLEIAQGASADIEEELREAVNLEPDEVFRLESPLQPGDLGFLAKQDHRRRELHLEPFTPAVHAELREAESIFEVLKDREVLLHHPYESFDPVVRFIEEAADDPRVLAIKQTFYRTSGDSPFVRALSRAAENGKQVACLVEIKARFDEENNINWARRLAESGVHVVYGLLGLKTHCKAAVVVRREESGIRRYVHLGTGNYNPTTARMYTDVSYLTTDPVIAEDVSALFNMMTGLSDAPDFDKLAVAPITLQPRVTDLIAREADVARRGEPARIQAKMNSLADPDVIEALYAASQAGVQIDLLVRGICCLRPGVPGISDTIRVVSIVDRFLEHARIFAFGEGKRRKVFISSADWMSRNLRRRVEAMVPIDDVELADRLVDDVLAVGLADNQAASLLHADGRYERIAANGTARRSQSQLMVQAREIEALTAATEQRPQKKKKRRSVRKKSKTGSRT